jgi:hypothetical protein
MRMPVCTLLLTLMAIAPAADAASTSKMPALLERAQYVALGYDLGDGFVNAANVAAVAADTLPEERRALEAIRDDLAKWGRYKLTDRPEQAEIFIVVRVGRRAALEVTGGGGGPTGSRGEAPGRSVSSRTIGGQLSSSDDRVDVYEAVSGRPGMRLWSGAEAGGMAGTPPRLYKSFRDEVEAAAKKP